MEIFLKIAMEKFESLFGVSQDSVKDNCVLLPLLPKGFLNVFGIKELKKGKLYQSEHAGNITFIKCGIGAGFVGDAVLYLQQTKCKNILLFGSCGLVNSKLDLNIGSLVIPFACTENESFTQLLLNKKLGNKIFKPENNLVNKFISSYPDFKKVKACTISSLKMEEEFINQFLKKKIDIVDMECCAFFAAALKIKKSAMALFYVSDVLNNKTYYSEFSQIDSDNINKAVLHSAGIIKNFLE